MRKLLLYSILFFYWYVVYEYLLKNFFNGNQNILKLKEHLFSKKNLGTKDFNPYKYFEELTQYIEVHKRGAFNIEIIKQYFEEDSFFRFRLSGNIPSIKYVKITDNLGINHVIANDLKEHVVSMNGKRYFKFLWRNYILIYFELTDDEYNSL